MRNFFLRHAQTFFYALGQLARTPFASLMTVAVIGIALALPAGLLVVVDNAEQFTRGWDAHTGISVFLKKDLSTAETERVAGKLAKLSQVKNLQLRPPEEALAEFRALSGFGELVDTLGKNPLPAVLILTPVETITVDALQDLAAQLREVDGVDLVQLDLEWVRRLYALLDIGRRAAVLLGTALATGVLLIVGNTIRLSVLNRREEIEVIKLVGGTNAFIRRPFLYSGALQGFFGAVAAALLLQTGLLLLGGPLGELVAAYGGTLRLQGMGVTRTGGLLAIGALLGWLGSLLAVARHLAEIEPS
jgi:cell division transport system permease protein